MTTTTTNIEDSIREKKENDLLDFIFNPTTGGHLFDEPIDDSNASNSTAVGNAPVETGSPEWYKNYDEV
jgi:hypothetical protein